MEPSSCECCASRNENKHQRNHEHNKEQLSIATKRNEMNEQVKDRLNVMEIESCKS